ncbi:unnamed protein product [Clonostachys solani]|uniref:Tafazzin n=1 Tax=Clonostachys solani TaxID=160281 RepID=A0A9P0EID9_9HYPO|nr:unnamed protein product [Clonostachys solani]
MPKKRQPFKTFKPTSLATAASSNTTKPTRNVNDILANLRRTSAGPSASRELPVNTPSVPPAIREILQIPETPAPSPRRPVRARVDSSGRRLPAGPPPPQSWVSSQGSDAASSRRAARHLSANSLGLATATLPGAYLPEKESLIYLTLRKIALDWEVQRIYNQYHIYYLPDHLKSALIRFIGLVDSQGVSLADLKLILLPPVDAYWSSGDEDDDDDDNSDSSDLIVNRGVTSLDLSGSVGKSLKLKEVTELLFPPMADMRSDEPQESWDQAEVSAPSPPRGLLPNLTHLSLALDRQGREGISWKQLLALSSKATTITHLSLAHWPVPCFTPRARTSTVTSPQGQRIAYGGTNHYSHTIDHDWSEALLILRMLSRNLYELEYLDLTGCESWFKALSMTSDHDYVDWVGSWGKMTHVKLLPGWKPDADSPTSEQIAYVEANEAAASAERHIRAMRAGKGNFILVERDRGD